MSAVFRRTVSLLALLFALWPGARAMAFVEANHAPAADLEAIKGIGPSTRERIVQARRLQPFAHWPDFIQRVPGIGPARAARLSAQGLTVNGQAYRPGSGASPATGPARGIGAPGPMPSGVPWQRVEPQPLLPLPR
jgi:competence protein ComEA